MGTTFEAGQEFERDQPTAYNRDAENGCKVENAHVTTDAEDSSIEKKCAHLREGQGGAHEEYYGEIKLHCVNEHTAMVRDCCYLLFYFGHCYRLGRRELFA